MNNEQKHVTTKNINIHESPNLYTFFYIKFDVCRLVPNDKYLPVSLLKFHPQCYTFSPFYLKLLIKQTR